MGNTLSPWGVRRVSASGMPFDEKLFKREQKKEKKCERKIKYAEDKGDMKIKGKLFTKGTKNNGKSVSQSTYLCVVTLER
jgi:hypothetical protein